MSFEPINVGDRIASPQGKGEVESLWKNPSTPRDRHPSVYLLVKRDDGTRFSCLVKDATLDNPRGER